MINISPKTITFITTYQCTAACDDCCFECSPKITHRLSIEEITSTVDSALNMYTDLSLVVFTGGECFLLKDDLFRAISYCTERNLRARCVTNGYWAKRKDVALRYAKKLKEAGVNEINISTGLDHQRWVSEASIINAVKALTSEGIYTLVTVEKDTKQSNCLERFLQSDSIRALMKQPELFSLQSNAWMSFFEDSEKRTTINTETLSKGCDQIYRNIVITPKKEVSACCGLTLEHIPEMKLGNMADLSCYRQAQTDDFLKTWIKVDGPYIILEKLLGKDSDKLKGISHQCEACAIIHKDENIGKLIRQKYKSYMAAVIARNILIEAKENLLIKEARI